MQRADTRHRIVAAAMAAFVRHGFHGTGLKQISKDSGAPIGSLYHFFPGGKDELAAAALRESGLGYQLLVEGVVDAEPDLVAGVRAAFEGAAEVLELSGYADACPVATVALEVASSNETLRQVTAEVFDGWLAAVRRRALAAGIDEATAADLAHLFVAALEGGFLLSRAARSAEPMRAVGRTVVAAAEQAVSRSRRAPASPRNHR